MNSALVSVIVPVYNVEKYIDMCLKSLVNQTYKNIEILVINDGSTDLSEKRCRKWKENKKIRYFSKCNEGLGATRNFGILNAKGKYIIFVDSDDFLAQDAVEVLVNTIECAGMPDIAASTGYFEVNEKTNLIKEIWQNDIVGHGPICSELERRKYLFYGFVMAWGKIYRKEFLIDKKIIMPDTPYEDNGIFPQIVFCANQIVFCERLLYYYRVNRNGSIISDLGNRKYMSEACENFLKYLKQNNMFSSHFAGIKRYTESRLKDSFIKYCQYETNLKIQNDILQKFKNIYRKYFGERKKYWDYQFCLLGSFGSRYIVQHIGENAKQLAYHFPFGSIISQMTTHTAESYGIQNENPFRVEKVREDFRGGLAFNLKDISNNTDFFFVDFLEERYDVAELEDRNLVTMSEAYMDSIILGAKVKRFLRAGTKEHIIYWKKACIKFAKALKKKYRSDHIILIRSRLTEQYQYNGKMSDYTDKDKIKNLNRMIEYMEEFFLSLFEEPIQVYSYSSSIYSLKSLKFCMEPQYLAEHFYNQIREEIKMFFDVP